MHVWARSFSTGAVFGMVMRHVNYTACGSCMKSSLMCNCCPYFVCRPPQQPMRILAVVESHGGMRLPEVVIDGMRRAVNKRQALCLAIYLPERDPRSYQVGVHC